VCCWVLLFLLFFDEHVAILGDSGDMGTVSISKGNEKEEERRSGGV